MHYSIFLLPTVVGLVAYLSAGNENYLYAGIGLSIAWLCLYLSAERKFSPLLAVSILFLSVGLVGTLVAFDNFKDKQNKLLEQLDEISAIEK